MTTAVPEQAPPRRHGVTAFEREIEPHIPGLFRLSLALCRNSAEAEDVLQEALIRAFTRFHTFDGRGTLYGWLCMIVRTTFIEIRRTAGRRVKLLDTFLDRSPFSWLVGGEPERQANPEQLTAGLQQSEHLLEALRQLPEAFRVVVVLCDLEQMSHEEAAEALGIPLGTVKSRQARGRAQLNAAFAKLARNQGRGA